MVYVWETLDLGHMVTERSVCVPGPTGGRSVFAGNTDPLIVVFRWNEAGAGVCLIQSIDGLKCGK